MLPQCAVVSLTAEGCVFVGARPPASDRTRCFGRQTATAVSSPEEARTTCCRFARDFGEEFCSAALLDGKTSTLVCGDDPSAVVAIACVQFGETRSDVSSNRTAGVRRVFAAQGIRIRLISEPFASRVDFDAGN